MTTSSAVVGESTVQIPGTPRSLVGAAVLSIIQPGLGHVYAGQARRGIIVVGIGCVLGLLALVAMAYIPQDHLGPVVAASLAFGFFIMCIVDAVLTARRHRNGPYRRYQRWWVYLLIIVVVWVVSRPVAWALTLPMRSYWLEMYVMPTAAMSDTVMPGDRFVLEKQKFIGRSIKHGDIVVFYREGPGSILFLMRVIGLPGDTIELRDEKLHRNDVPIDEPYVKLEGETRFRPEITNFGPITVPAGRLFMMGDNRRRSDDSRYWGSVPIDDVLGHVMVVYFSSVPRPPDTPFGPQDDPDMLRAYGIDDDNPPGKVRWERIGKRIIDSGR